ncbi:MAG: methyltransferase domain-containing protein, partial [Pseudomonadota bacterium]
MERMVPDGVNAPQIEYWNGPAGDRWARSADTQDVMIGNLGAAALDACQIQLGHAILDIGCGSGSTTLEIARRTGDTGIVVGIDISAPMLEVANKRLGGAGLSNVRFENRDAATHCFEKTYFDRVYSRFGVMFFVDPVPAFQNIRSAVKPDGRLAFVCWQARTDNQWMELPFGIALRHVAPPPPALPGEPGPTAFANPDRVRRILSESNFGDIQIEPLAMPIMLGGDIPTAVERLSQLGPTGRLLRDASEDVKAAIAADLAKELRAFLTGDGVKMKGSAWVVTA